MGARFIAGPLFYFTGLISSLSAAFIITPVERAEPLVAEESVYDAVGLRGLVGARPAAVLRIPARKEVLDAYRMAPVYAHRQPGVPPSDELPSIRVAPAQAAYVLLALRRF